ncbi:MAG TPA: hypothetical protein VHU13_07080 [Solirubrobacteraceae bacterium]|jgi:hypothetical protein|nr:hypothetical protein [Solirubrobacteraceae bacterium]
MRLLAGALAVGALALSLAACAGSGSSGSGTAARAAANGTPALAQLMVDQDVDSRSTRGYYDGDDGEYRLYGQAASPADRGVIAALVARYYADAAAGRAQAACSLTYYQDVESLPEQYGRAPGPRWLEGANTCPALLARVFRHYRSALSEPPLVVSVRVQGNHANALVGFRRLGAGYVTLHREGRGWKVDGMLAAPLP